MSQIDKIKAYVNGNAATEKKTETEVEKKSETEVEKLIAESNTVVTPESDQHKYLTEQEKLTRRMNGQG